MGKGSSSGGQAQPTQTTSTVNQSSLPAYAQPYFENLMGSAQSLAQTPYQPYTGDQVAGFTPNQTQGFNTIANNQGAYQPFFNNAAQNYGYAAGVGQTPGQVSNSYTANNFNPNSWTQPGMAQTYMSPYMQNVTDIQSRESNRQFGIQQQTRNTQAAQGGAFGGYRQGIMDSEAQRNQNVLLNDIQAQGLQSAYGAGQGQYNTEQSMFLGANQAGQQNLQNQSQLNMNAQNMTNTNRMQGAQLAQSAAQGQQGLGQATQAGVQSDANALLGVGSTQQNQQQNVLNTAYQNFLNQQYYPFQTLNWESGILHGVPVTANQTVTGYQVPPSPVSQVAGLGLGAAGLAKMMG